MTLLLILLLCGAVLLLPAWLLRRFGYRRLTYSLAFSEEEVSEGDTVQLIETVCSEKLLPLPWVKAELTTDASLIFAQGQSAVSDGSRFVSSFFSLRPYRRIERRWQVRCTKRGIFTVSHAVLVLSDLFGTAELSQPYPDAQATLRVLPAVTPVDLQAAVPPGFSGEYILNRTLIPDRFAICGIRPYADGDPMRDICWSATARSESPMVWQYQETATPSMTVLLDSATRPTDRDRVSDHALFEQAIRVCASYLHAAANARIPVRFLANTELGGMPAETPSQTGPAAALELLRLLAALPDTISGRFTDLLRHVLTHDPAAAVIVIAPQPDAELLRIAAAVPRLTVISVKRLPAEQLRENIRQLPAQFERRTS